MMGDWKEELEKRTGIRFQTTEPKEIEKRSFEIIKGELGEEFLASYPEDRLPVLIRVIHTTADFSYRDRLYFSDDAMEAAEHAIRRGCPVVTDTTMAASGINKAAAGRCGMEIRCFIGDEDVKKAAEAQGITRSAASVDKAARLCPGCIYVVGNAPTALMRLCQLMDEGRIRPSLVIGLPVGFVNVEEAKELLIRSGIPCIVGRGRKGGSNVAAAVCNALLYRISRSG